MTNAQALLQNREIEIASLLTLRLANTTQIFRFQNWLQEPYDFQGLRYNPLAYELDASLTAGRGVTNTNVPYLLRIPEQKIFSIKRNSVLFDGFRNSLVTLAFIFPNQINDFGSEVEPVRFQKFKVRASAIKNSVMTLEIDSLTDANFSAIGDLLTFPTFHRQKTPRRDAHWNYPR